MPETIDTLAQKIKAKYPVYADKDNRELVSAILTKYPTYQDSLGPEELPKLAAYSKTKSIITSGPEAQKQQQNEQYDAAIQAAGGIKAAPLGPPPSAGLAAISGAAGVQEFLNKKMQGEDTYSAGKSGALTAAGTVAGGKLLGWASEEMAPLINRLKKPDLIKGVARDVTSKYVSPRLGKAILPEAGDELAQAIKEGTASRIPKRLTKDQIENLNIAGTPGGSAIGKSGVAVIPEPREALPVERPGAMYSVPREQLPGLAQAGKPGAGEVMSATGTPVIYSPKEGVGFPGPRTEPTYTQIRNAGQAIPGKIAVKVDSLGIKWAETPEGVRVSIPKRIPDAEVMDYAKAKLAEQQAAQSSIKARNQ